MRPLHLPNPHPNENTPPHPPTPKRHDPLALRHNLRLNQTAFWCPLDVTQSGGSRYEYGRKMPPPVARLLDLVYVKAFNQEQIEAHDMAILRYLKETRPDLYATLTKAAGMKPASARKSRPKK